MDFQDNVVMITGAASGMGAATAREFAADGATVVIVDRNRELAEKVAAEIEAPSPIVGDVSDSAFCNGAVEQTMERQGRLDVLV
ncbi:MAG: SDR family NAD(P)-dependent oxidoreductase, partial [Candidatus Aminicenantaceae bacterium]